MGTCDAGLPKSALINLKVDPLTPATLYATAMFAGVFKSADGGTSWEKITSLPGALEYSHLFDPFNAGTLYARSRGVYAHSHSGDAYKSIDGGKSWVKLRSPDSPNSPTPGVYFMGIAPTDPATLLVGVEGSTDRPYALHKSSDGGATWNEISSGLPGKSGVTAFASDPANPTELYLGIIGRGVFKSTNGGNSWQPTASR